MDKPIVDLHELAHMEVQSHMRPFIVVNMMEHEETRHAVKSLTRELRRANKVNYHDVIEYALIVVALIVAIVK